MQAMIKQFNDTYKAGERRSKPTLPETEQAMEAMIEIIGEELSELVEAFDNGDIVGFADALGDILYATTQQADLYGFPVDALAREIHRSNMTKLGSDGLPIIDEVTGKVLKGPNFEEPRIAKILQEYGTGEDQ